MKQLFLKIVFLILTLYIVSCNDNDNQTPQDQLPPITQTGANTFGCIINGEVLIPKDSYILTPGSSVTKGLEVLVGHDFFDSNGNDKWFIRVSNFKDSPGIYIYIYIPTLLDEIKEHPIQKSDGSTGNENSNLSYAHIYSRIENRGEYRSYENSGELIFSKNNISNGIYSGTFNVKLKNKNDENDIIEITDGRFDINLNSINI